MFDTQHMSSSNVDCMQCFLCTVLVGWCVLFCTDSALWHAGILQWTPAKGRQSRLDDGFTNDQVEEMKNRISKHRGLFKPPLTPERFWDPDIIEDSADDPRNKIFHASPLRKRREEKAFEVG